MPGTLIHPVATPLSGASLQAYLDKGLLMGQDAHRLAAGEEIVSYFQLHDFNSGRRVLSNATDEQHRLRLPDFYGPAQLLRTKLGQGKHDRGEAVAFAGAPVSEEDARGINRHFPICVKGISVLHKVVRAGTTWDVTLPPEVFGMAGIEELYTTVNIGTLVLEAGAALVVRGNVFSLLCQRLIVPENTTAAQRYHIGILPTPFSVDFGHGPQHGIRGRTGAHGLQGRHGIPGELESSILGPWVPEQSFDELSGTDATDGDHGGHGGKGRNGGMCKLAELTIRELHGHLRVFSQAGAGGDGGDGGDGGNGGQGGNGAPPLEGFNEKIAGGNSGHGGHGGDGGRGGNAGHGGLSSNIYVNVPEPATGFVHLQSIDSVGGMGGAGGRAGTGGQAGLVAVASTAALQGRAGNAGKNGVAGKKGLPGRGRPAARYFLNDQWVQS